MWLRTGTHAATQGQCRDSGTGETFSASQKAPHAHSSTATARRRHVHSSTVPPAASTNTEHSSGRCVVADQYACRQGGTTHRLRGTWGILCQESALSPYFSYSRGQEEHCTSAVAVLLSPNNSAAHSGFPPHQGPASDRGEGGTQRGLRCGTSHIPPPRRRRQIRASGGEQTQARAACPPRRDHAGRDDGDTCIEDTTSESGPTVRVGALQQSCWGGDSI
jgi:hypothetical protein